MWAERLEAACDRALEINARINDDPAFKERLYGAPVSAAPNSYETKEVAVRACENTYAVGDSVGMCRFTTKLFNSPSLPGLEGRYLFGDFVASRLWALSADEPYTSQLLLSPASPASIDEGPDGRRVVSGQMSAILGHSHPEIVATAEERLDAAGLRRGSVRDELSAYLGGKRLRDATPWLRHGRQDRHAA